MTVARAGLTGFGGAKGNCPWVSWPRMAGCPAWIWRNLTLTDLTPQVLLCPATPSACSLNLGHSLSAQFACPTFSVCKLLFILPSPSSSAPFFMQSFLILQKSFHFPLGFCFPRSLSLSLVQP